MPFSRGWTKLPKTEVVRLSRQPLDGIRPSERGKGYGSAIVSLAIDACVQPGIRRILLCCDTANVVSARTILKNGGVLKNEVLDGGVPVQRYGITR